MVTFRIAVKVLVSLVAESEGSVPVLDPRTRSQDVVPRPLESGPRWRSNKKGPFGEPVR